MATGYSGLLQGINDLDTMDQISKKGEDALTLDAKQPETKVGNLHEWLPRSLT